MARSIISVLAGLCTLCVLLPLVAADGDLNLCESETDPVLYNKRHAKTFSADDGLVNKEVVDLSFEGKKITCIQAINRWTDGTGGTATLKEGGLGLSSAKILVQGQFFRGYSFNVMVRGDLATATNATPTTSAPTTMADNTRISQSCFCVDICQKNIFDDRIFVPSFNMD